MRWIKTLGIERLGNLRRGLPRLTQLGHTLHQRLEVAKLSVGTHRTNDLVLALIAAEKKKGSGVWSSRRGCNPAGARPAVPLARFRHVAMPLPWPRNWRGSAWGIRPGRPRHSGALRWGPPGGQASWG